MRAWVLYHVLMVPQHRFHRPVQDGVQVTQCFLCEQLSGFIAFRAPSGVGVDFQYGARSALKIIRITLSMNTHKNEVFLLEPAEEICNLVVAEPLIWLVLRFACKSHCGAFNF